MLQTLNQKVIGFRMHVVKEILSHFQILQIGERIGTKIDCDNSHLCGSVPCRFNICLSLQAGKLFSAAESDLHV